MPKTLNPGINHLGYKSNLHESFSGRSGDGAGKGRRACNYVYVSGILISGSKKLIQNADWQR